jgi:hypothetical protein
MSASPAPQTPVVELGPDLRQEVAGLALDTAAALDLLSTALFSRSRVSLVEMRAVVDGVVARMAETAVRVTRTSADVGL